MHWNGSIDVSTTGLREGGMFTDRRPSAHGPIQEEGGVGATNHSEASAAMFVYVEPAGA